MMRKLTPDSLSSAEMNTTSKGVNFPSLNICDSSSHNTGPSHQVTNREANVSQDHMLREPAPSNETDEILRITLLYLEGINSPSIPSTRVSAWVGFRSSFPPNSMTVSSSNYSSYFLKEGSLLSIESDQVKWTPEDDDCNDGTSSSFSGIAFWDSITADKSTASHLEIITRPQSAPHSSDEYDNVLLPDILEFHVCVVCERAASTDRNTTKNSKWIKTKRNKSLNNWDNEFEEAYWYSDEEDDGQRSSIRDDGIPVSLDQQLHHGVAYYKVDQHHNNSSFDNAETVIHLPIRAVQAQSNPRCEMGDQDQNIFLSQHAASLTIQVEKVYTTTKTSSEQRHYVENCRTGEEFASSSVKCDNESSKNDDPKDASSAEFLHSDEMKSIISGQKATRSKQKLPPASTKQRSYDEEIDKIQEVFQASLKSAADSNRLVATMRQERQMGHVAPEFGKSMLRGDNALPTKEAEVCAPSNSLNVTNTIVDTDTNDDIVMHDITAALSMDVQKEPGIEKQKSMFQQKMDHINSFKKKTIMSRLLCGNMDLAEAMLHCDEDHVVGVNTADSFSLSSINT